jgi:hypothetical protein
VTDALSSCTGRLVFISKGGGMCIRNPMQSNITQALKNVDVIMSVFQIEIFSDCDGQNNEEN